MATLSKNILTWHDQYGRHDLPWQIRDPYIVWVSEVMLQQTQVKTVLGYFERFMQRFPTVHDLAHAEWDDVAELWAGLGYYARARNLHKAAKQVVAQYNPQNANEFPQTLAEWQALSGIGQSTAGAIMAMGLGHYGVILDGNVKRVLTRYAGISNDVTKAATLRELWALADTLTPDTQSPQYAQAMMDMGATLCTRLNPACERCPIQADCEAHRLGTPTAFPVKKKKEKIPTKTAQVIILQYQHANEITQLWIQRPSTGLWGGLWCFPILEEGDTLPDALKRLLPYCDSQSFAPIKHTFSHFHWLLTPVVYTFDILGETSENHTNNAQQSDRFKVPKNTLAQLATDSVFVCQDQPCESAWLSKEAAALRGKPRAIEKILAQLDKA